MLNDNTSGSHYGVDVSGGLTLFVNSKNNTFSGNLTIEGTGNAGSSELWLYNGGTTNPSYTPLGAATGNIILSRGGELKVGGYVANQLPIIKNNLSFNGTGWLDIDSGGSNRDALQLTTLTRNDRSVLYIEGQRDALGNTTGNYEQVTVTTGARSRRMEWFLPSTPRRSNLPLTGRAPRITTS